MNFLIRQEVGRRQVSSTIPENTKQIVRKLMDKSYLKVLLRICLQAKRGTEKETDKTAITDFEAMVSFCVQES